MLVVAAFDVLADLQLWAEKSYILHFVNKSFIHLRIVSGDAILKGFPYVIKSLSQDSLTLWVLLLIYSFRHANVHSLSLALYALYVNVSNLLPLLECLSTC